LQGRIWSRNLVSFKLVGYWSTPCKNMKFKHHVWCDVFLCDHAQYDCRGWAWVSRSTWRVELSGDLDCVRSCTTRVWSLHPNVSRYPCPKYSCSTPKWFGWAHVDPQKETNGPHLNVWTMYLIYQILIIIWIFLCELCLLNIYCWSSFPCIF
jgi:hypothetical protein